MTSPLVEEIRALDIDLAARISAVYLEHQTRKAELLDQLLAELRSVPACCQALGISRQRWYQLASPPEKRKTSV